MVGPVAIVSPWGDRGLTVEIAPRDHVGGLHAQHRPPRVSSMVIPNTARSARKRLRLASVRTLLVLVMVLAVCLAYLVDRVSHRRRAAEAIRRAEGRVVSRN